VIAGLWPEPASACCSARDVTKGAVLYFLEAWPSAESNGKMSMHSRQPASMRVVANSVPADALVGTEIDGRPTNGQMHDEPEMSNKTPYLPALK